MKQKNLMHTLIKCLVMSLTINSCTGNFEYSFFCRHRYHFGKYQMIVAPTKMNTQNYLPNDSGADNKMNTQNYLPNDSAPTKTEYSKFPVQLLISIY